MTLSPALFEPKATVIQADVLLERADRALSGTKHAGRNRVRDTAEAPGMLSSRRHPPRRPQEPRP